jgi:hypothetical protein
MYYLIALPLFLQYLTNANILLNSWSVASKPTVMILRISPINGLHLERILDKILYEVDSSDIPQ